MLTRVQLPVALLLLASCACSRAQTPKPPQTPPAPKQVDLPLIDHNLKLTINQNAAGQLLLNPDVQRDMGLSADAKTALLNVYAAYNTKYTSLTSGKTESSDELAAQLDAAMLDAANQAIALLSPSESARLSQLGVQALGFDALRMPEVRKSMSLTPDQTAQLDKLLAEVDEKQAALDAELGSRLSKLADPGPKATDEETAALKRAQKAVEDELEPQHLALVAQKKAGWDTLMEGLSPDQKAAWHTLHGKPITA